MSYKSHPQHMAEAVLLVIEQPCEGLCVSSFTPTKPNRSKEADRGSVEKRVVRRDLAKYRPEGSSGITLQGDKVALEFFQFSTR